MDRKVYIEKESNVTKIVLVENGTISRYYEIPDDSIVGSIYRGKVLRVTSNGAFVDLGGQEGFLSGADVKAGDYVTVLVDRDGEGQKKARLTTALRLSGIYSVVTTATDTHFSSHLSGEKREELLSLFGKERPYGVIFRSACEDADQKVVMEEMEVNARFLMGLIERAKTTFSIGPLYICNAEEIARQLGEGKVEKDFSAVRDAVDRLKRRVVEKEGIELVFDRTEAMTVVDVNVKRNYVGVKFSDRLMLDCDLAAATFVAEQIRLRNLGGLIAVDFINVQKESFEIVKQRFDEALRTDFVSARAEYCDESCVAIVTRKKQYSIR